MMKVPEDQMTKNAGRKHRPCMNQNILDGSLTRNREKNGASAVPCRVRPGLSGSSGTGPSLLVCYWQSHGGVSEDDLSFYSNLFPKTTVCEQTGPRKRRHPRWSRRVSVPVKSSEGGWGGGHESKYQVKLHLKLNLSSENNSDCWPFPR